MVPNAPCGIESSGTKRNFEKTAGFLMHRVELKAYFAPFELGYTMAKFLMHRVELKGL